MCCAMSLVCPPIATHHTCQFWVRNEPVNMTKTIKSPAKCGVHAVIWLLYSQQTTRNVVLRYCPSSWQCSAAHCSCNKEASEEFLMGSVWSLTIIRQTWLLVIFISLLVWNDRLFDIVVSMSDCHPRGPGLDSRLYPRNFSGSIESGMGSTQPHEDNWVATWYEK